MGMVDVLALSSCGRFLASVSEEELCGTELKC